MLSLRNMQVANKNPCKHLVYPKVVKLKTLANIYSSRVSVPVIVILVNVLAIKSMGDYLMFEKLWQFWWKTAFAANIVRITILIIELIISRWTKHEVWSKTNWNWELCFLTNDCLNPKIENSGQWFWIPDAILCEVVHKKSTWTKTALQTMMK